VQVDDDFEGQRGSEYGGRRSSDAPTVSLREHLETLIRGIQIRQEQEVAELHASLKEFVVECRESWAKHDDKLHKVKTEVSALRLIEENRRGQKDAQKETRLWVQWLPSVIAAGAAVAAVVIALSS
jgi:hypothetical protein